MLFFSDNKGAKRKKRKKLKKKQKEQMARRTHIIIEARKKHLKNRKELEKTQSGAGYTPTEEMGEQLGMKVAAGIDKTIAMGGKAMERLKRRQKSLSKSKNTHLAKLQAARGKVAARSRT